MYCDITRYLLWVRKVQCVDRLLYMKMEIPQRGTAASKVNNHLPLPSCFVLGRLVGLVNKVKSV